MCSEYCDMFGGVFFFLSFTMSQKNIQSIPSLFHMEQNSMQSKIVEHGDRDGVSWSQMHESRYERTIGKASLILHYKNTGFHVSVCQTLLEEENNSR